MPKAADVAKELRRVAEALEREPEAEIRRATVCFFCDSKEQFKSTARVLPKPLAKKYDDDPHYPSINRVHLKYENDAIDLDCSVYRSLVCRLVEHAKAAVYECEPLLSEEELEAV